MTEEQSKVQKNLAESRALREKMNRSAEKVVRGLREAARANGTPRRRSKHYAKL